MPIKRLLCPQRLRHIPPQFSWVDQRLVREHYIERCTPEALALYLLLVTVADAQGLSYYADRSVWRLLSLPPATLEQARAELIRAGLIAYRAPLYQVLALECAPGMTAASPAAPSRRAAPEPLSAALARVERGFRDRTS